ncbi:MAG: hypothetical protein WCZ90_17040 [Melioribacteraceae bacterium]
MKTKMLLAAITFLLLSVTSVTLAQDSYARKIDRNDIEKIKKIMNQEKCFDIKSKLYVINDSYCFWIREGNCSDNSYTYNLYGPKAKLLCYQRETIAGTDKKCDKQTDQLFVTIIANLEKDKLGLGANSNVRMVYELK